ncbi:hypothetical protein LSM04_002452 [Trypanosoma melophagium]|uniref:uncharacterized protein n=1 Tax=Trypanosoma melophagium TaxID=715481 RepID=UPI00351A420A|nr:hypothetical protein LSM04_002452 [Trypanosoma melophagium]
MRGSGSIPYALNESAPSYKSPIKLSTAANIPLSPSPVKGFRSFVLTKHVVCVSSPILSSNMPLNNFDLSKGHMYNIPVKVKVPLEQQLMNAFRNRTRENLSLAEPEIMIDKEVPCSPFFDHYDSFQQQQHYKKPENTMTSVLEQSRGNSAPKHNLPTGVALVDIGTLAQNHVIYLMNDTLVSPAAPSPVVTGFAGEASNDEEIACATLLHSLESELHGQFIREHVELWQREYFTRRILCACEEQQRRLLSPRSAAALHERRSSRLFESRRRLFEEEVAVLAAEERELRENRETRCGSADV